MGELEQEDKAKAETASLVVRAHELAGESDYSDVTEGAGSAEATQAPIQAPTQAPTQEPTQAPTQVPAQVPTQAPTQAPTQVLTQVIAKKPRNPRKAKLICICLKPRDKAQKEVRCMSCNFTFHRSCVGIDEADATTTYECPQCRLNREKAGERLS